MEPRAGRLPQGSGRHHPPVAKAVFGIDDQQRQILVDRRVLKTIVEHYCGGAGSGGGADTGSAVPGYPARRDFRQQQSLVADRGSIVLDRIDPDGAGKAPAIPAGHDLHRDTGGDSNPRERQHDRGLA